MQLTFAALAFFAAVAAALPNCYEPETVTVTTTCIETVTTTLTTTSISTTTYTEPCKPTDYSNSKRSYYPVTYYVTVGGPGGVLAYNPPKVYANVGDTILFEFLQLNHTATESNFVTPCIANGNFDTGFVPNPDGKPGFVRAFNVVDAKPHWFYCRQTTHCGKGMVFALNPPSDDSVVKFRDAAILQGSTPPAAPQTTTEADYPEPTETCYTDGSDYDSN